MNDIRSRHCARARRRAVALLLGLSALPAMATQSQEWRFKVFLDDDAIGEHTFRVSQRDTHHVVESKARFDVKILFVPVYSYEHHNIELWEGDCLKQMDSRTVDNGERFEVQGRRLAQGFVVAKGDARRTLPGCVMSFAYWNPQFLAERRLLNAQTGDYEPVSITPAGDEELSLGGTTVRAQRYRLSGPDLSMILWYSPDRRWLGLESTTPEGRKIRYRLQDGGPALGKEG